MLVDNSLFQPSYFTSGSSSMYQEYPTDLNEIFDTELFNSTFTSGSSLPSSSPSGSRGSTPQHLMTPPQESPAATFPDVHDDEITPSSFYPLFDDFKSDPLMPLAPSDFLGVGNVDTTYGAGSSSFDFNLNGYAMAMDLSNLGVNIGMMDDSMQPSGIDPQLVDTPSAVSDHGEDDSDEKEESPSSPVVEKAVEKKETEKTTITIAPVKVGGHGKARKGTVQSGGVVKKVSASSASKEKENATSIPAISSKKVAPSKPANPPISSSLLNKVSTPGPFLTTGGSVKADSEAGDVDEDDDLPQDWRPSPEVFAKMTSKEKRQLRNKISARNFRVRRKEYISTLEGDIAERDRMLDHFRTQLGSQESENLALRQEIAALKKALLEGRGGPINLPPPAPLPEHSAAEVLAASTSTSVSSRPSTPLVTANTQKDLPSSPRMGTRFWGGVGIGGGFTPVHTTLVPDISTVVRRGLQENMNPALNGHPALSGAATGLGTSKGLNGFDGFADLNPFTMKTLDAYRMHLWGKMAAQQHAHQQNQNHLAQQQHQQQSAGLAANLRPHFFTPSQKGNMPSTSLSPSYSSTLSALLSGKHASTSSSSSSYITPPASPVLNAKGLSTSAKDREVQQQREKEHQQAMLAAMASQTILRKLGSAFWDAFTGSSSSSSPSSVASSSSSMPSGSGNWDADKVHRVLSGKAVLRVVDVEPATPPTTPKVRAAAPAPVKTPVSLAEESKKCCSAALTDILEESMRSLTIGKKM